ncbi:MAG: helix-turn-helix transcriptional regulator [Candidatus Gastranaerophilales bacterium]|nr:helix-turn-helix transcriptional regulator [Candidatus Gastranaerophilales bacterium]
MKNIAYENQNEQKSSKKLADFLEKNNLHKKDFAKMVGVTLSYVYNLIDENVPFSTRSITLERIATVMDINPEDFTEYQIPSDSVVYGENLLMLKDLIKENNMTTLDFLKMFDRKKRLELVDILRGAKPILIDFEELKEIAGVLNMTHSELFKLWKTRMLEYLQEGGFNIDKNAKLVNAMFNCANGEIEKVYNS